MSLYLTCTDPEVVEIVGRNMAGRCEAKKRAHEWATERGSESGTYFPSNFAGRSYVRGLPIKPEGFGQWKKGDRRGCHRPYSTNKPEVQAMRALEFTDEKVPGLPDVLHAPGFLLYPTPFTYDGAAWIYYSHMPEPGEREKIGGQWVECLASEYHRAHEGWVAS